MQRSKWTERKFVFDFPEGWMANILERLRGTPARISKMTSGLSDEDAAKKHNGAWSIKEHIGHLADLEELHEGRIDDFIAGQQTLRAADMNNAKTNESAHTERPMHALLADFSEKKE